MLMSEHGAILDSDLQTYAQGMAGEKHPELFRSDPVLDRVSPANSIPNLQRWLAGLLLKNDDFAGALLTAGAICIFVFYSGWYLFGRVVFRYPVLAAMLSLLMGITVWIGWGTFWGINHSDPVPRVFFAALFPFLLILGVYAVRYPFLRPLTMLFCGLAVWVHGVNALNCGAMFFMAFLLLKNSETSFSSHLINLVLCLAAFFIPVLIYLWPSLAQGKSFSQEELALFHEFFKVRWRQDYSGFASRLFNFFSVGNPPFLILVGGLVCWALIYKKSKGLLKDLCLMYPSLLLAIILVIIFCWAESEYAPRLGRLPMGHELIRGIRLCIPLSWIMVTGLMALYLPRIFWRISLICVLAGILFFTSDRQYVAAQYFISQYTGIQLPLADRAGEEHAKAIEMKKLAEIVKQNVPEGEKVFVDEDLMPVRYLSLRPLAYAFKDGYVHYYNKDFPKSVQWLKTEKILSSSDSVVDAWLETRAPWIISRKEDMVGSLLPYAELVDQAGPWRLYKQK